MSLSTFRFLGGLGVYGQVVVARLHAVDLPGFSRE